MVQTCFYYKMDGGGRALGMVVLCPTGSGFDPLYLSFLHGLLPNLLICLESALHGNRIMVNGKLILAVLPGAGLNKQNLKIIIKNISFLLFSTFNQIWLKIFWLFYEPERSLPRLLSCNFVRHLSGFNDGLRNLSLQLQRWRWFEMISTSGLRDTLTKDNDGQPERS